MMDIVVMIALGVIGVGIVFCLIRIVRGPTPFDRVLAFDAAILNVVGAFILDSILLRTGYYLDVILVVTLLGFLGLLTLTAYLEGWLGD
ncbi:monovalent cation/H+ antiporter complex subunit F [soil metagenome]